jgi:2-phospho-L-lactate/phosphoenolpyruvate guanylyltransferase
VHIGSLRWVIVQRSGVIIPIRAFALGKERLADELGAVERAELGRRLADRVATAAAPYPTIVVTSDDEVRAWAVARGLAVVDDPGSLDDAAAAGCEALRSGGCTRGVVAHADLPRAATFRHVVRDASLPIAALVPCHRDDGTPVLSIPLDVEFPFAYGPGSFRRHVAIARELGLGVRVVRDPDLGFDVDTPDDLAALVASGEAPRAGSVAHAK